MDFMARMVRLPFPRPPRLGSAAGADTQEGPLRLELDPRMAAVARPARAVSPDTRVGLVAEILRTGPYRAVAVVDEERLVGMVTEGDLLRALLGAEGEVRARLRERPARDLMAPPAAF